MKTRIHTTLLLAALLPGLQACSGGGGGNGAPATTDTGNVEAAFGLLKPAESDEEMADSLRRAVANPLPVTGIVDEVFAVDGGLEAAPVAGDDNFSTTNLQEAGVDEADHVKYDGKILYLLDRSGAYGQDPAISAFAGISLVPDVIPAVIRLLRTDTATPAVEEVATIEFESSNLGGGIYLYEAQDRRHLLSIGHDNDLHHWALFALDYFWQERRTHIAAWDVEDPQQPSEAWSIELEGSLLTSRRIDNILYLVTRHTPVIEGILPWPATQEDIDANLAVADQTELGDYLPDLVRNGGEPEELLDGTDCYLPNEEFTELDLPPATGSLITVSAINLEAPEQINSICFNSFASSFYASRNSLYITTYGSDNTTLIHKIRLADGDPEYRGSGEVPGYLGTGSPSFLMSEQGDDLRVVSSTWEDTFFPLPVVELDSAEADSAAAEADDEEIDLGRHRLTILRESADGSRLEQIAQIPNAQQPDHIGKPGEDLYAARFLDDRAYLVTFEVIDPLYVIDLAEPEAPVITGELEIPGFSTLLQPVGEGLLLGIGQEVPEDGLAITQGVKLSLFNVTDLDNPVELATRVIGKRGSFSTALHDHHALTLLQTDSGYRAAIPITRHDTPTHNHNENDPWNWYDWTDSGLHQFEIDTASGTLEDAGVLVTEERSESKAWPVNSLYDARSVIHGDAVFFISAPDVWAESWGAE